MCENAALLFPKLTIDSPVFILIKIEFQREKQILNVNGNLELDSLNQIVYNVNQLWPLARFCSSIKDYINFKVWLCIL